MENTVGKIIGEKLGRKPTKGLSPKLEKTLGIIRNFLAREGLSPSVHDLAGVLGISGASAHAQIVSLESKGYIKRTKGRSRSIEIIKGLRGVAQLVQVPIIGRVAAGVPILAVENIVGEISVSSADARGHCFALEVVGDSMIDAGINEGDFLVVRQQPIAENGDIVVAMVGDEATVKRLFISEDQIELRPANEKYKPIQIGPQDVLHILGKVMAVSAKGSIKK
jgi:repressor LexA